MQTIDIDVKYIILMCSSFGKLMLETGLVTLWSFCLSQKCLIFKL